MLASNTIYSLKRAYGLPATYHRKQIGAIDFSTGAAPVTVVDYPLLHVIILPRTSKIIRRMLNEPFNFGGHVDKNERWLMIDAADLSITPMKNDYLTFGGLRDVVVETYLYDGAAHVLKTRTDG